MPCTAILIMEHLSSVPICFYLSRDKKRFSGFSENSGNIYWIRQVFLCVFVVEVRVTIRHGNGICDFLDPVKLTLAIIPSRGGSQPD